MNTLNKHRLADWSTAPEWATHHAVDASRQGYWYGYKIEGDKYHMLEVERSALFDLTNIDLTQIDWRETLESRPDPELPEGMKAIVEELITLRRRLNEKAEENRKLHEKINRLTLDRITAEERHDPN